MKWRFSARVTAEVVLVFVGILAAFWLESWWQERGEQDRENVILQGMQVEFDAAEALLVDLLKDHNENLAGFQELHQLLRSGEGTESPERVIALSHSLWNVQLYEPKMPAYQSLIDSSGLDLIRSNDLRLALTAYEAAVSSNRGWDDFLKAFDQDLMIALLAPRVPYFVEVFGDDDLGGALQPDIEALANDMEFRNLIAVRAAGERSLIRRRNELRVAVREVREEIALAMSVID